MGTKFLTARYSLILSSYWMGYAAVISILMTIAALAALPTVPAFNRLLKKQGTLLCTNIADFYALQLLQLLVWGMITMVVCLLVAKAKKKACDFQRKRTCRGTSFLRICCV